MGKKTSDTRFHIKLFGNDPDTVARQATSQQRAIGETNQMAGKFGTYIFAVSTILSFFKE